MGEAHGNNYFPGSRLSEEQARDIYKDSRDFFKVLEGTPPLSDAFVDGLQDSVIALAVYGKEPDKLTAEERASLPFLHRMARATGTFVGDSPVYLVGGAAGGLAGGAIGAGAGAIGLREALHAACLDKIRKGEVKDFDDFMQRAWNTTTAGAGGALTGATMAAGGMAGAAGASRLGLGAAGRAAGTYAGQLAGLNSATTALRGELPTAQEFMDGAVLILGFNAGAKLAGPAGARVRAVRDKLIDITEQTGLTPGAVAKDVQANPEYARSVLEEPGAKSYIFAKTVESAARRMGAESPLSYLRQTQVEVVEVTPRFAGRNAREVRRTQSKALEKEIAGDYRCEQTGEVMYLPRAGVEHAQNSATRSGPGRLENVSQEHMEAVVNFPTLIQKAVLGETHPSKPGQGIYASRYYAVMRTNEGDFVVKITAIREPGKAVSRAEIESIDRVYDLYLTKKLPKSVQTATSPQLTLGDSARSTPGSNSNISPDTTPVNSGKISLFHVLEGLKDSADKKTPLFRPKNSQ